MEYGQLSLSSFETRFLRILRPKSSQSSRHVRAEIVTESLTSAPKYCALSYTWSNERLTHAIEVDGRDVLITRNLEAALLELDLPEGTLVWIDALSINQNDLYEKSYQVSNMGEVYARAESVIAWVGEANGDTEHAMELLHRMSNSLGKAGVDTSSWGNVPKNHLTGALQRHAAPSKALRGLVDLLSRPYWERIWIIQELAKAKQVVVRCGRFNTNLEHIWRVFEHVPRLNSEAKDLLKAIKRFRLQQADHRQGSIELLEALVITQRSRATELRDRVYALLSLVSDGFQIVPLPDYTRPLETVFSDISTRILARTQQLAIMSLACRTLDSWQSNNVEPCSRLAVQWTEVQEYVPHWVLRSVHHPEAIRSGYRLVMEDTRIEVSAEYLGTITDCESSAPWVRETVSPDPAKIVNDDRTSWVTNTVPAYKCDMIHIYNEVHPNASSDPLLSKPSDSMYPNDNVDFAKRLLEYRREETEARNSAIIPDDPLLSPFQRIGPLQDHQLEVWSLAALYAWNPEHRGSRTPRSSELNLFSAPPVAERGDKLDLWADVEARLDEQSCFGMKFGIVERAFPVGGTPTSDFVSSGIAFICQEARVHDSLFLLPGLRHPVILRPTILNTYHMIGDCIFRVDRRTEWSHSRVSGSIDRVREIYIDSVNDT